MVLRLSVRLDGEDYPSDLMVADDVVASERIVAVSSEFRLFGKTAFDLYHRTII